MRYPPYRHRGKTVLRGIHPTGFFYTHIYYAIHLKDFECEIKNGGQWIRLEDIGVFHFGKEV